MSKLGFLRSGWILAVGNTHISAASEHLTISNTSYIILYVKYVYSFSCSVGSNQNGERGEEGDDLLVFVLNPKTPHPHDAHLVDLRHLHFDILKATLERDIHTHTHSMMIIMSHVKSLETL